MEALFPLILWLSQLLLGSQCGAPVEGVTEHSTDGTVFVGAISEDESCGSVGVTFRDGTFTFENRGD